MEALTHLSLFTGIGGIDIAAEWAGFKTVGQCEYADYPIKVLEKHWPNVPRWRDIRTLTKESFYERTGLRTIDIISGGFPCQPFSVAGKQKGKEDDRYLWPEMLRVIRELKPRWVLGENVPGIIKIAGKTVCEDLEREGYAVAIFNFEAAAVGAPHRRERVFFVANTTSSRWRTGGSDREKGYFQNDSKRNIKKNKQKRKRRFTRARTFCTDVADANRERLERSKQRYNNVSKNTRGTQSATRSAAKYMRDERGHWATEPDVGRVANGIPSRVDRLKCLGNAVVPQQVYPILRAIAKEVKT